LNKEADGVLFAILPNIMKQIESFLQSYPISWSRWSPFCNLTQYHEADGVLFAILPNIMKQMESFLQSYPISWSRWSPFCNLTQYHEADGVLFAILPNIMFVPECDVLFYWCIILLIWQVKFWITLNEPWVTAFIGYGSGDNAPGTEIGCLILCTFVATHWVVVHTLKLPKYNNINLPTNVVCAC